jgi:hypothetical protein
MTGVKQKVLQILCPKGTGAPEPDRLLFFGLGKTICFLKHDAPKGGTGN